MKINSKHKDLLGLVTGRPLREDVEVAGVIYKLSSLNNGDHTWVAEGMERTENVVLLAKNRKDRMVAAAIAGVGAPGGEFIYKQDMFEMPGEEYGALLKTNDVLMNQHLNEQMLVLVSAMDEKVVSLLHLRVLKLNERVEAAIEEATPFLKAQDV